MNNILTVGKHNQTYQVNWHSHKGTEIIFCTSGSGTLIYAPTEAGESSPLQIEYTKNDLIIVPAKMLHSNMSVSGFRNIHVTLDEISTPTAVPIKIKDTGNKMFYGCMNNIYYIYNCELTEKSHILQNLGDLLVSYINAFSNQKRYSPMIEKMRFSIYRHFAEPTFNLNNMFDLEENYNSNYLKKLFKKEIGTSPQQFLIDLRITYAKKLLSNTLEDTISISHVAYECGYDDPLYFSRVFKTATGSSPKEFHKQALASLNVEEEYELED